MGLDCRAAEADRRHRFSRTTFLIRPPFDDTEPSTLGLIYLWSVPTGDPIGAQPTGQRPLADAVIVTRSREDIHRADQPITRGHCMRAGGTHNGDQNDTEVPSRQIGQAHPSMKTPLSGSGQLALPPLLLPRS